MARKQARKRAGTAGDPYAQRITELTEKRKRFAAEGNDAKVALVDLKLEQAKDAQARAKAKQEQAAT